MSIGFGLDLDILNSFQRNILLQLFANGENGFLYENMGDLTRLYTTSQGPTPAAVDDDPIGLMIGNSQWGGKSLETILTEKPNLVTNGTFDTGITGWTDSSSAPATFTWGSASQQAVLTRVDAQNARMDQQITTVAGRTYAVDVSASFTGGGAMRVQVGTIIGDSSLLPATNVVTGTRRFFFVATGTTAWLRFFTINIGVSLVDNVSVKELPGNHAIQAVTANRPTWKSNNGKPYLNFNSTQSQRLISSYIPESAGTVAIAFRANAVANFAMGGGTGTGNKRVRIGLNASGFAEFDYNDQFNAFSGPGNKVGVDVIMLQTWNASTRECWIDNVQVLSESRVSNLDGTGNGYNIGSFEGGASFLNGRVYAALALNRKVTAAEVARITLQFQRRI